jgi:hypothetical protein
VYVLRKAACGSGAVRADRRFRPYTTNIHALQYDGVTQPSACPINVPADANAPSG